MFFNSIDGVNTYDNLSKACTLINGEESIVLELAPLPFRRLWSIEVYAHNCAQHPLTEEMELGINLNALILFYY